MKQILLFTFLLVFSISYAQKPLNIPNGVKVGREFTKVISSNELKTLSGIDTTKAISDQLVSKISADYIIEKIGSTYYARPSGSLTAYSGSSFSTVFSSALTTLTSGDIVIKAGTYVVDAVVTINNKSNIRITGAGKEKTIFKVTAATGGGNYDVFDITNTLTNFELSGIKFLSYLNVTDANPGHLIYANNINGTNINIHDCEFTAPTLNINGIFLGGTTGTQINGMKFYNNVCDSLGRIGIEMYWDTGAYANAADSTRFRNIDIYSNQFNETGMYGTWGLAISLGGNVVNVHDNIIVNNSTNQAIEVGHSYGASVYDNKLYITKPTKSKYFISGYRNYDYSVMNNTFYGVIKGSANTSGINISECYNTSIVGNTLNAQIQRGFYIQNSIGGLIHGNTVSVYGDVGISLVAGTQKYLVEGNRVAMINATNSYGGINLNGNLGSTQDNVLVNNFVTSAEAAKEYTQDYITTSANVVRDHNGVYRNAVTATSDGLTTGILPQGSQAISVTSANANDIVTLPIASTATIGTKVWGKVGANGFELRVAASQATTAYLNGVTNNVEAAIGVNVNFEAVQVDYNQWVLKAWTSLGAPITAIVPDAN